MATTAIRATVLASALLQQQTPGARWDLIGLSLDTNPLEDLRPESTPPWSPEQITLSTESSCQVPDVDNTWFVYPGEDSTPCSEYELTGLVLHENPLVLYIPSFVSGAEAAHIIKSRFVHIA